MFGHHRPHRQFGILVTTSFLATRPSGSFAATATRLVSRVPTRCDPGEGRFGDAGGGRELVDRGVSHAG
jgi:hypothetical protein